MSILVIQTHVLILSVHQLLTLVVSVADGNALLLLRLCWLVIEMAVIHRYGSSCTLVLVFVFCHRKRIKALL